MFNQPATPFGSPAVSTPATPFGTQTNTTPAFGAPSSAFGTGTTTTQPGGFGAFGSPPPAPSGFGAFGSTAPAPATGGFGSTTTTGGFASPPAGQSTGGFGTAATNTTPFGAPQTAGQPSSGGLFGAAPAPAPLFGGGVSTAPSTGGFASTTTTSTTGGFGGGFGTTTAPSTSSAFGAPSTTFGSSAAAPSTGGLFGSPAPAFGPSPAAAPSAFGAAVPAPAPGVFLGSPPSTTTTTGFGSTIGASPQAGAGGGTRVTPYQVTTRADGSTSISLQAIAAMPAYEQKSFEELRFEDYSLGNRGDGSGTGGFGAGFGAAAPAPAPAAGGSLFGAPAAPAPGGFGAAPAAPAFGAAQPAPAPAFGAPAFGAAPAPAPVGFGGFGTATSPAPAPGGFGGGFGAAPAAAKTPLFGTTPAAPAAPLFGAAPAPAAPAPGGLFGGSPAPAPGLFGAPAPAPAAGGIFGAPAPAPATGGMLGAPAPAPAAGSVFGVPAAAPATSLFGAPAPAAEFGAPAAAFGAPAAGGFGAPKPAGTSLFGAAPGPATGSFFGATAAAPATSLFGAPAPAAPLGPPGVAASVIPPTADAVLAQQLAAVENQRRELEKLEVWRGRSPQASRVIPQSFSEEQETRLSRYPTSSLALLPYQASPRSSTTIRPRGFAKIPSPGASLGSIGKGGSPIMSPHAYVGSSVKRLVIKPGSQTPKPSMKLRLTEIPTANGKEPGRLTSNVASTPAQATTPTETTPPTSNVTAPPSAPTTTPRAVETPVPQNGDKVEKTRGLSNGTPSGSGGQPDGKPAATPRNGGYAYEFYQQVVGSPKDTPVAQHAPIVDNGDFVPRLTKPGYTVSPSLEALSAMSEADLAAVSGFSVEREGYGGVEWDGAVDVRGVDLDTVVSIEERDVAVYDVEEASGTKPPVGSKLNRSAVITIYKVFPKQGANASAVAKAKFERKIAKQTRTLGAELISYDATKGEWKFRVSHFSRYGLVDDSDDDDEDAAAMVVEQREFPVSSSSRSPPSHFESGERGGRSPRETQEGREAGTPPTNEFRELIPERIEDEAMTDIVAVVSDVESSSGGQEAKVIKAAEDAYVMMLETELHEPTDASDVRGAEATKQGETDFPDEGVPFSDYDEKEPVTRPKETLPFATKSGICSKLMKRCGLTSDTASSTDYGMRMGRSFRVGWNPNGSFLHLSPASEGTGVLMESSPVFRQGDVVVNDSSKLQTHLRYAKSAGPAEVCPSYSLPKSTEVPGGTTSSYKELSDALSGYVEACSNDRSPGTDPERSKVVMRAFTLLISLYGQENNDFEGTDSGYCVARAQRRVESFATWLRAACGNDVGRDVRSAKEKNDVHSAIFAALSGGDIAQACSIATEHGYLQISAVLSAGMTGTDDVLQQVQSWNQSGAAKHIPASLLRIYTLLSGDLELEESLYVRSGESPGCLGWRRRLAMSFFFGNSLDSGDPSCVSSLVCGYDTNVASGVAPYPSPRYMTKNRSQQGSDRLTSLLYGILRLQAGNQRVSLSEIISPTSYTASAHDFSNGFHLAAVMSALGCCPTLTSEEEAKLVDSYVAQLINGGMWEWAAYVLLCFFGGDRDEHHWRQHRAKDLVLQHFRDSDPVASQRRAFLEKKVGLPSSWFEEALVDRCANGGDAYGYVSHLSKLSPERATEAFEDLLLPNLLFTSPVELGKSMKLLEVFGAEEGTLASAVLDFFRVSGLVLRLSKLDHIQIKDQTPQLLDVVAGVQAIFMAYKADIERINGPRRALRVYPGYKTVSHASFLAEALAGISFLHLQLKALESGVSIEQGGRMPLKGASQLAFLSSARMEDSAAASKESILRSLI